MTDINKKINPLYTIFEKHLYDFDAQEDNEGELIDKIVVDYINLLQQKQIAVPKKWVAQIHEELKDQVRQMLVKKIYGCLSIDEYLESQKDSAVKKKKAKKRYSRMF